MAKDLRILALDIGTSNVKMAEFLPLKNGGVELINFGTASLGAEQQNDAERMPNVTAAIKEIIKTKGIRPGPAVISVSGQSVFSRFVRLPPVEKDKVHQIIMYEAQQNVPFPINEVVWDYQLIGRGDGELDVMLAAIKADIVVALTDAVQEAGLETDIVDVAPMALYNAVRYNYGEFKGCTLIVDIGARSTDLIFVEEGRVFIRSVPVAGNAITQQIMREFDLSFEDAEEMKRAHGFVAFGGAYEAAKSEVADKVSKIIRGVMTRMHAEIDRSIKFYRSQQNGQSPQTVLITGGCSAIPYSDAFLKEKLKVDVDYLNPFINVPVTQNISSEDIGRSAHMMGQLVGLALRKALTCPIEINLLPPKVLEEKTFRRKQPFLVLAAFGLALMILLFAGYFQWKTGQYRESLGLVKPRVDELTRQDRALSGVEGQIAQVNGKLKQIDGLLAQRGEWIQVLSEIQAALPTNIWLSQIIPLREPVNAPAAMTAPGSEAQEGPAAPPGLIGKIAITGHGYTDEIKSTGPVNELLVKLQGSSLFSERTKIDYQPLPAEGDVVRNFRIVIFLKKPLSI